MEELRRVSDSRTESALWQETSAKPQTTSAPSRPMALLGLATAGLTVSVCLKASFFIRTAEGSFSNDLSYLRTIFQASIILIGGFFTALIVVPLLSIPIDVLRRFWRGHYTVLALLCTCTFLGSFVILAGRWQFGGFDYNVLMELGWRQALGQRPYVDFPTSTPPAFNIGIKLAYQLFGVSWDANLYLTAFFTCVTFLWLYWLLRLLSLGRIASWSIAFAIQSATMLLLCFWWYNNITLVLSAVAFLSTLYLVRDTRNLFAKISYVVSLALLSLAKPNIAGVTIIGCVALAMIVSPHRTRTLELTFAAAAMGVSLLLLNHVSIPALLASYCAVARERGFGTEGLSLMNDYERYSSLCWIPILSLPLFALLPRIKTQIQQRDGKGIASSLFFLLGPFIAAYGVATNGEYRDVECAVLLAAGAVIAFGMKLNSPTVRRIYIALVFASIASDLFMGAMRLRVYSIGPHMFFEWKDNQNRIEKGVLKEMRVSSEMIQVLQQASAAAAHNSGPYFFGPRVDFNYSVLGIPSPEHSPAWWQAGTAFARSDVPHLLHIWQGHRFQTLIFLKGDCTYYPPAFLDLIARDYARDDSYPSLTLYHRRASTPSHNESTHHKDRLACSTD